MIPIIAMIMGGMYPLLRAYAKRIERSNAGTAIPAEVTSRLERIEQAVDAIAVEVERISEGQRFTTKLLSETTRVEQKLPARSEPSSNQPT
ncbi:MAG: hypothetical protein H0W63_02155 [Gemmatimonadaceae bacterium]|nr:hypothetical protein [Gemmatimonadaceae bacterium]